MKWARTERCRTSPATVHPDDLAPPAWQRLREMAWHLPRILAGLGPGRAARARRTGRRRWSFPVSSPATGRRWTFAARSRGPAGGCIRGGWAQPRRQGGHAGAAGAPAGRDLRRAAGAAGRLEPRRDVRARAGASASGQGARGSDALLAFLRRSTRPTPTCASCTSGSRATTSNEPPFPRGEASRRCRRWPSGRGGTGSSRRARRAGRSMRSTGRSRSTPTMSARCCGGRR